MSQTLRSPGPGPVGELADPFGVKVLDLLGMCGGRGQLKDIVGAQDVQVGALGHGDQGKVVHNGAINRRRADWTSIGVPGPDGVQGSGRLLTRFPGAHRGDPRQQIGIVGDGEPVHRAVHALCGEGDPRVVQRRPATDRQQPAVGITNRKLAISNGT